MSQVELERPPRGPAILDPGPEPRDGLPGISRFTMPAFPKPARRSYFMSISFVVMVVIPSMLGVAYYSFVAARQYVTTSVVALRVGEDGDATKGAGSGSLVSSVGPPAGGPAVTQSYGLVDYVQSAPAINDIIRNGVDVRAILSRPEADFLTRLAPGASQEALLKDWRSKIDVDFEVTSGVITIKTRAYTAQDSLTMAEAVLDSSERLLNAVTKRMHGNELKYAEKEQRDAEQRLVAARAKLQAFRSTSGVLDLGRAVGANTDIEVRLRQELLTAEGQAENLRSSIGTGSPMYAAAMSRSKALRQQLKELDRQTERTTVEREGAAGAGVMSQYEALSAEIQLAERFYSQANDLLQQARYAAVRQGTYLLTFVRPVEAMEGLYPDRLQSSVIVVASALLAWAVFMLLSRAVLDHA